MTRRARGVGALALALLVAIATAACGETRLSATSGTLVEGIEVRVSAIDNTFRPETLTVSAGTEVRFTNDGRAAHDVLSVEGNDWGVAVADFEPGDEYVHRFTEPGTYDYYCSLHGTTTLGMVGTVEVVDGPVEN